MTVQSFGAFWLSGKFCWFSSALFKMLLFVHKEWWIVEMSYIFCKHQVFAIADSSHSYPSSQFQGSYILFILCVPFCSESYICLERIACLACSLHHIGYYADWFILDMYFLHMKVGQCLKFLVMFFKVMQILEDISDVLNKMSCGWWLTQPAVNPWWLKCVVNLITGVSGG
jgi:hypothetical protein